MTVTNLEALRQLRRTIAGARWWNGWSDAVALLDATIADRVRVEELEVERDGWQDIALRVLDGVIFWEDRAGRLEAAVQEATGLLSTADVGHDPSRFTHARTVLERALSHTPKEGSE